MSEELLDFFAYDASTPLRFSLVEREEREGTPVTEIRFDNGAGGDAEAFVVGEPGRPGVVVAHGGTGPGKHIFLAEAAELARRGSSSCSPTRATRSTARSRSGSTRRGFGC